MGMAPVTKRLPAGSVLLDTVRPTDGETLFTTQFVSTTLTGLRA